MAFHCTRRTCLPHGTCDPSHILLAFCGQKVTTATCHVCGVHLWQYTHAQTVGSKCPTWAVTASAREAKGNEECQHPWFQMGLCRAPIPGHNPMRRFEVRRPPSARKRCSKNNLHLYPLEWLGCIWPPYKAHSPRYRWHVQLSCRRLALCA